jgi:hypothetical protein
MNATTIMSHTTIPMRTFMTTCVTCDDRRRRRPLIRSRLYLDSKRAALCLCHINQQIILHTCLIPRSNCSSLHIDREGLQPTRSANVASVADHRKRSSWNKRIHDAGG